MESIIIYTDGGCRGNQQKNNVGGWGATLSYKGQLKEISGGAKNTTNNIMEMTAVIEALKIVKRHDIPVKVHVDSAYVLNGITNWIHGWIKKGWVNSKKEAVKNKELWQQMYQLKNQFKDIEFIKVKGHSGDAGNDRVDYLCNLEMDKLG